MRESGEPRDGDFVAYVEQIEREQLARALQPHKLPQLAADGKVVAQDEPQTGARKLSADETQRLVQALQQRSKDLARGALVGAAIGIALIVFGLAADGGFIAVVIGAIVLWHSLRKLRRSPERTRAVKKA